MIAALCRKWDVIAITDEIYEHIIYDGASHVPIATLDGMADRTVTINSLSKTYSVTGWRVGWTISPPSLTGAIRKVHDFLTVGAAAPLQEAGVVALGVPESYYARSRGGVSAAARSCCSRSSSAHHFTLLRAARRVLHHDGHRRLRLSGRRRVRAPSGEGRRRGRACRAAASIATPRRAAPKLRFCFCKKDETLIEADRRLAQARPCVGAHVH